MADNVKGRELVRGDHLGSVETAPVGRIVRFESHPGLEGKAARIAVCQGEGREWEVTVFDDDAFRAVAPGVYVPAHLAFGWRG